MSDMKEQSMDDGVSAALYLRAKWGAVKVRAARQMEGRVWSQPIRREGEHVPISLRNRRLSRLWYWVTRPLHKLGPCECDCERDW